MQVLKVIPARLVRWDRRVKRAQRVTKAIKAILAKLGLKG